MQEIKICENLRNLRMNSEMFVKSADDFLNHSPPQIACFNELILEISRPNRTLVFNAMKRFITFLSAALLVLLVAVAPVNNTFAKGKPKKSTPVPIDTNDKITAVHLTSVTVNIFANQKAQEYRVTPQTKITINGIDAKLSGLTTGMDVTVKTAADGVTAEAIEAKTPKH